MKRVGVAGRPLTHAKVVRCNYGKLDVTLKMPAPANIVLKAKVAVDMDAQVGDVRTRFGDTFEVENKFKCVLGFTSLKDAHGIESVEVYLHVYDKQSGKFNSEVLELFDFLNDVVKVRISMSKYMDHAFFSDPMAPTGLQKTVGNIYIKLYTGIGIIMYVCALIIIIYSICVR